MKKTSKTKKKKRTKKSGFNLKYVIYLLLIVIFSLLAFIIGVLLSQKNYEKEIKKSQNTIKQLEEKINKLQQETKKSTLSQIIKKEKTNQNVPSEIADFKYANKNNTKVILPPALPKKKFAFKNKKPKLVIIIDDVSFKYQVNKIKQIPYDITPSFFPPTKRHPNTVIYAKEFTHYMIHLPLEAIHFKKPEPNTLNINDSYQKILARIIQVKKDFPNAKFLNNHTGSTFTANTKAMEKLFKALKKEHLGFVDSKTTPYSKSEIAEKYYHIPLYSRNIFLDNEEKPRYIRNQLKKAVKIAQKRGYAIAIGHPHLVTLKTLKNAKDILKNVNVVYIDELSKN